MNYMGPITFVAGLALGLLLSALIMQDACAGELPLRHIVTETGLHCVVFGRGKYPQESGGGISCNWDDFNFRKYHENIKSPQDKTSFIHCEAPVESADPRTSNIRT